MSKVAMCVCPTALVATAVTTIPKIRHAVHSATKPQATASKSRHRKMPRQAAASLPCPPSYAGPSPAMFTLPMAVNPVGPALDGLLSPTSATPGGMLGVGPGGGIILVGGGGSSGGSAGGGGSGGGGSGGSSSSGGVSSSGGGSSGGVDPGVPAVPEPASWLFMVGGFGVAGLMLRRRHWGALPVAAGSLALGGSMPLRAKIAGVAGSAASETAGVAVSAKSAALAKLALCVCPPALIAGTVATIPAARHAVYDATAPKAAAPVFTGGYSQPCDPMFAFESPKDVKPAASLRNIRQAVVTTI